MPFYPFQPQNLYAVLPVTLQPQQAAAWAERQDIEPNPGTTSPFHSNLLQSTTLNPWWKDRLLVNPRRVSFSAPHALALGIWHAPMAAEQHADLSFTATTAPMQRLRMVLIYFYPSTGTFVFVGVWLSIDSCLRHE